jgi:hypothetical protein
MQLLRDLEFHESLNQILEGFPEKIDLTYLGPVKPTRCATRQALLTIPS